MLRNYGNKPAHRRGAATAAAVRRKTGLRKSRRRFLAVVGLILMGGWLTRRGLVAVDPDYDELVNGRVIYYGSLQRTWTNVQGLYMHSLVSIEPAPRDAPAIVLVHGSGLSGRYMIPTARELTADFRVYVPDLPGFGDSDKPEEIYNVPELADWLAAWMPAVGLQRASFLGNSFGCQVIADLAARYPERVEHAILQGPTTPPEERSWYWQFIRWRENQRYNPSELAEVTDPEYSKAGFWRMFRSFRYQITDPIEDKAPHILAPVLVVRGEVDPISNQRWCEAIAQLCPRGYLELIPGVAHTLCYTAPVLLAGVTRRFIREHDGQG